MLFPSFQENCPYAPMEAASCGRPVVFRDLVEYRSLYRSEYLKAGDLPELTLVVRRLLDSASERERWASASHALSQGFRVADFVDTLARIYDDQACAGMPH